MDRSDVTAVVLAEKRRRGLSWSDLAKIAGRSKEWSTAAPLGQMALSGEQAGAVSSTLGRDDEAIAMLQQVVPYNGRPPTQVPTDPLIHRFYANTRARSISRWISAANRPRRRPRKIVMWWKVSGL